VAFDPIDVHVGSRVRQRRVLTGLSQSRLGEQIGVTFQQMQKYESGANRISASRLYRLSQVLGIQVQYFFDDVPDKAVPLGSTATAPNSDEDVPTTARESLELLRSYYAIDDAELRRSIRHLVKCMEKRILGDAPEGAS
jgi:transcriptional regulator with XRE-family HTH domain